MSSTDSINFVTMKHILKTQKCNSLTTHKISTKSNETRFQLFLRKFEKLELRWGVHGQGTLGWEMIGPLKQDNQPLLAPSYTCFI